jgi:hypothetical protein
MAVTGKRETADPVQYGTYQRKDEDQADGEIRLHYQAALSGCIARRSGGWAVFLILE